MYQEKEIKELIQQTVSLIPEHTWPIVADQLSARIVDTMPPAVLEEITGNPTGFKQAEEILLNYYLESIEKREDLISDAFGFVGAESTLYFLEGLELDKVPEPKQKQETS
jgi:hypothetical protein|tara:strand:+ start:679 stop:1008 length:330 start_codon:yes stop_codon:yes gene_type:complete